MKIEVDGFEFAAMMMEGQSLASSCEKLEEENSSLRDQLATLRADREQLISDQGERIEEIVRLNNKLWDENAELREQTGQFKSQIKYDDIIQSVQKGEKIHAIKQLRHRVPGINLRVANAAVDMMVEMDKKGQLKSGKL